MISKRYNPHKEILEVVYSGEIYFDQIKAYIHQLEYEFSDAGRLRIFTDATAAEYKLKIDEVNKLLVILEGIMQDIGEVKIAFLHTSPKETAFSILLENTSGLSNYHHKVFSTREQAIRWLLGD